MTATSHGPTRTGRLVSTPVGKAAVVAGAAAAVAGTLYAGSRLAGRRRKDAPDPDLELPGDVTRRFSRCATAPGFR